MVRCITLQSFESVLSSDRAFCGSQLGDFALVGLLGCDAVCLLGAGFGEAIPAIMTANPDARVVAVDNDPQLSVAGKAIQRSYFPAHAFEAVCADAFEHLAAAPSKSFDALCVDLFTENGYAELYYDDRFWDQVARVLASDGVVMVNTWGLPSHLKPFDGPTPHVAVGQGLAMRFGDVRILSHLRNQTLLAGPGLSRIDLANSVKWPYRHDALAATALISKYRTSTPFTVDHLPAFKRPGDRPADFAQLAALYDQRLIYFADDLQSRVGIDANPDEPSRAYLRRVLVSPHAPEWLESLLRSADPETAAFVPSYFCSYSAVGDTAMAWFPDWLVARYHWLAAEHADWLWRYALWHVAAVASNPLRSVKDDWLDRLTDVMADVVVSGSA